MAKNRIETISSHRTFEVSIKNNIIGAQKLKTKTNENQIIRYRIAHFH